MADEMNYRTKVGNRFLSFTIHSLNREITIQYIIKKITKVFWFSKFLGAANNQALFILLIRSKLKN